MKWIGALILIGFAAGCLLGLAALSWWTEVISWVICAAAVVAIVYPLITNKRGPHERA